MATPGTDPSRTVLADLELSRGLAIQWALVGTMGFAVAWGLLEALYASVTGSAATYGLAGRIDWWTEPLDLLLWLVLATAIVVPHEWLHGVGIRRYGGEPRYGVGLAHFVLPYAYATTDHRFTRDQFVVVLLLPLVAMTLVGVPVMLAFEWGWLVVPLAANAGGTVGDLWMTLTLLGYPPHVAVEDHRHGFRILGRPGDRPRAVSATAAVWDALAGAAVASVGLLLAFALGGLFVLDALGAGSVTLGRPGTPTFLFSYVDTPTEISVQVGTGVPVLGALAGLCYSLVRAHLRPRRQTGEASIDAAGRD